MFDVSIETLFDICNYILLVACVGAIIWNIRDLICIWNERYSSLEYKIGKTIIYGLAIMLVVFSQLVSFNII